MLNIHFAATEPNSSTSHSHSTQVAPGVFIETFNVPIQGDGVPPEINRVYFKLEEKVVHLWVCIFLFIFLWCSADCVCCFRLDHWTSKFCKWW